MNKRGKPSISSNGSHSKQPDAWQTEKSNRNHNMSLSSIEFSQTDDEFFKNQTKLLNRSAYFDNEIIEKSNFN